MAGLTPCTNTVILKMPQHKQTLAPFQHEGKAATVDTGDKNWFCNRNYLCFLSLDKTFQHQEESPPRVLISNVNLTKSSAQRLLFVTICGNWISDSLSFKNAKSLINHSLKWRSQFPHIITKTHRQENIKCIKVGGKSKSIQETVNGDKKILIHVRIHTKPVFVK